MKIQVLGTGCAKCEKLAELVKKTADEAGVEYTLEKVRDINDIIALGVMSTPAMLIDGVVKAMGRVPTADEVKKWIA